MSGELHLSIVVPVYRSEDCLAALHGAIVKALDWSGYNFEVIFVNDFSPDNSWSVIEFLCSTHPNVIGIDLRRNFGQDNAILTGVRIARGKYVAIMDDDLQHHPKFLPALLREIEKGSDVVYADLGKKHQKLWKNAGSWINGKIAEWVLGKPKGLYISPYKIMRADIARLIGEYPGYAPYVDGLIFQTTARITSIEAEHQDRFRGRGNYTLARSIGVSARLAFSFSARPLRLIGVAGLMMSGLGFGLTVVVIIYRLMFPQYFTAEAVGWASLMVAILVSTGIQMILFGALAEYTGRSFLILSNKPQTSIRQALNNDQMELTEDWINRSRRISS